MKNRSRIVLLFILFTGFLTEAQAQNNSLLWEITGKGLKDTSYLFGTIHIRDKRVFDLGDSTYYAIHRTKALFGELNLQDKAVMKQHASELLMPAGSTLQSLISAEDYELVKKYCKKHIGMYALLINKIKPIYISAIVSEDLLKKEKKKPLDLYLQDYAAKRGNSIGGIETFEEQLAVINLLSVQEQADMLVEQIKHIDEEKKLMEYMLQLYLSESLDSLEILVQEDTLSQEFNEAILDSRNMVMVQRMEIQMKKQSTFFAVGAAHLPGTKGLIALLRKQGYTVRPVKRK
ncbi:TraB/GumN family protein [Cytophaga aurantiaca]|uniref:TraB/GumN family protein n=1 Tax=Cytophaga aurantiaca TaxID=29530 RepID=UPI000373229E|nr:TraB/GumN family protein [Cytophaga aurantiaca]